MQKMTRRILLSSDFANRSLSFGFYFRLLDNMVIINKIMNKTGCLTQKIVQYYKIGVK